MPPKVKPNNYKPVTTLSTKPMRNLLRQILHPSVMHVTKTREEMREFLKIHAPGLSYEVDEDGYYAQTKNFKIKLYINPKHGGLSNTSFILDNIELHQDDAISVLPETEASEDDNDSLSDSDVGVHKQAEIEHEKQNIAEREQKAIEESVKQKAIDDKATTIQSFGRGVLAQKVVKDGHEGLKILVKEKEKRRAIENFVNKKIAQENLKQLAELPQEAAEDPPTEEKTKPQEQTKIKKFNQYKKVTRQNLTDKPKKVNFQEKTETKIATEAQKGLDRHEKKQENIFQTHAQGKYKMVKFHTNMAEGLKQRIRQGFSPFNKI